MYFMEIAFTKAIRPYSIKTTDNLKQICQIEFVSSKIYPLLQVDKLVNNLNQEKLEKPFDSSVKILRPIIKVAGS
jgi:hypothetical protein